MGQGSPPASPGGLTSDEVKKFKAEKPTKKIMDNYQHFFKQDFSTTDLNQKWVADIPYIDTIENGWYYLSMLMDFHSRNITDYHFIEKMETDIVVKALEEAILTREIPRNCARCC